MSREHAGIHKLLLFAIFSFVVAVFPPGMSCFAHDDDSRTMEVEGTGKVINDDFSRARNEAIRDALRRAVEEATAAWFPAGFPVQKMPAIKEALDARAEGYVQDYRIVSEKPNKNLYSVIVRATVSAGNIIKDLQSLGFIKPQEPGGATFLVTMTIRGLTSYTDYVRFKELLRSGLGGVKSLSERQIEWKTARVDLQITGTAKALAAELTRKSRLPLDIRKVDRDSIEIAVLH